MTDDELMTLAGTNSLVSFYDQAPSAIERIAPADVQARRIGHFGFFREQFSQSCGLPRSTSCIGWAR